MSTPRLMIVEDEGIVANDIAFTLSNCGFEIAAICMTGEEALSSIETTQPNLVLLDIKLAGKLDGIEVALRIRAKYKLPVIFLTSHSDEETFIRANRADPAGYLLKPFHQATLCTSINRAIEN